MIAWRHHGSLTFNSASLEGCVFEVGVCVNRDAATYQNLRLAPSGSKLMSCLLLRLSVVTFPMQVLLPTFNLTLLHDMQPDCLLSLAVLNVGFLCIECCLLLLLRYLLRSARQIQPQSDQLAIVFTPTCYYNCWHANLMLKSSLTACALRCTVSHGTPRSIPRSCAHQ